MKKFLLPVFFLFFTLSLSAQYTYSYTSAPYANLVNPDTLSKNVPDWDDDYWTHEIGFPVNVFGTWYDSVVVESNGSLILYNTIDSANFFYQTDTLPALMGFGEFISTYGTGDLVYRYSGTSPILYELTGAPGARIAKFEWRDCGFYNDTSATYTNFINFQIWLYEITGDVEYHFGTHYIDAVSYDGNIGPVIGIAPYIADPDYDFFAGIFLRGDSTACTSVPTYDTTRGTPVPDAVHRFANLSTIGIKENLAQGFVMYPNPANENVNLILPAGKQVVTLSDVAGRICVREESNDGGTISISLDGLQAGVYFISVSNEKTTSTQRLIVR